MMRFKPVLSAVVILVFCLCAAADEFTKISSIVELAKYAAMNDVKVVMEAGQYRLDQETLKQITDAVPAVKDQLPNEDSFRSFIRFSGSGSVYKLSGVSILIDSKLHRAFGRNATDEIFVTGNNNHIEGLDIKDVGDTPTTASSVRMVHVIGDDNTISNISLLVSGSSPYGYGNNLGKGKNSIVPLHKHTSLLVTGKNNKIIGCRVITLAFGHGIVMQGSVDTLIKNCYVEGRMRNTNDILAEKSGMAFDLGFKSDYPPGYIPPSKVICLSEDGVRAYPSGSHVGGRRTLNITVLDTTVKNMRSGFDLSEAGGKVLVSGCTSIGCNEKGYNVPSGGVIEKSKGDAMYGPLLGMFDERSRDCRIELELMDTCGDYPPARLAEINGIGHKITISNYQNKVRELSIPIVLGRSFYTDVNHWRGIIKDYNDRSGGSGITLINRTQMPILICDNISDSSISTDGIVIDDQGTNNKIVKSDALP